VVAVVTFKIGLITISPILSVATELIRLIREAKESDARLLLELLTNLDKETDFMLYEPGERKSTIADIQLQIRKASDTSSILLVAEENEKIVGFLSGDRGFVNRIKHSCYLVIGILRDYARKGIGTTLFQEMEKWARLNSIERLELTVMIHNEAAIKLYKKMGFRVEGLKEKSLRVDGKYIDEYYMSKIL
jgi:RimJ/RimL family protein N-acetyltransferase